MQKKKCEICGEMVPQCNMSKSYKHRCKKCVADMTRANRHAEKQKQEVHDSVPHTLDPATPYGKPVCTEVPKMNDKEFDEIIQLAIQTYGKEAQTQMLFEEMAELQNAICKLSRGRATVGDVCEEIADVMIMCFQMAQIYGVTRVEQLATFKMRRLADRLGYNIKAPASVKDGVFHGEDELLRSLSTKEGGAK